MLLRTILYILSFITLFDYIRLLFHDISSVHQLLRDGHSKATAEFFAVKTIFKTKCNHLFVATSSLALQGMSQLDNKCCITDQKDIARWNINRDIYIR